MIKEATDDLEEHLQRIDDKLNLDSSQDTTKSDEDEDERRQMEEEKLSAEQCLSICAQLSAHIDQLEPSTTKRGRSTRATTISPEYITNNTLLKCKEKLNDTATVLDQHIRRIDEKLKTKSRMAPPSEEYAAELARLREQREGISQCIAICSEASEGTTTERANVIEDFENGDDSCQFLVSTLGELIWARRVTIGIRSIQVIGQTDNTTLQQVSRDHHSRLVLVPEKATPVPENSVEQQNGPVVEFRDRFGPGFKLSAELSQVGRSPSIGQKGDKGKSSPP